jgi:uncharacterized YigZ family protein
VVNEFFTVGDIAVEREIIEKKSRFIAKVIKVNSEKEANEKIAEIKKIHRDARHNVFAYRIANGSERFSDDGEPSGTAGVPILNILRGEKLENILVVVTRYFGGILLGTGGLVRAYSLAAKEAVLASKRIEMKLCDECELIIDYNYYDILNHYLNKKKIVVKKTDYNEKICITVIVEKEVVERFLKEIEEIMDRNITHKVIDTYYYI